MGDWIQIRGKWLQDSYERKTPRALSAAHVERLNRAALWLFLGGLRLFDQGLLAHHDNNPRIGHMEPPPIGFSVIADLRSLGKANVTVNDRPSNARVSPDIHVVIDDRVTHLGVAVHTNVVPDHAPLYSSAGNHRTSGHDGIERHAHSFGIGKDEFRWRILVLPRTQWPMVVIQIEN